MTAPKTRRRKGDKTRQRDLCDTLFGKLVRSRGGCIRCGRLDDLQCAHGFSRSYYATRWDERNAFPACRGCHLYYTVRPLEWDCFLHETWGDDLYAELRALALTHRRPDMAELLETLKARVA